MDTPVAPSRTPALALGVAALLVVSVSAGVLYFLNRSADMAFDPVATAELVPDDTHLFLTFNTDFASRPWTAVPRLLDALDIEDDVRADLRESAADEDYDFDAEIVPALATISRAAIVAQYVSPDEVEWLYVIDSRDRDRVLALMRRDLEDRTMTEQRDEELGLTFEVYADDRFGPDDTTVLTTHDGILYLSEDPDHVANFIRRRQSHAPLSDSQRFRDAVAEVEDGALLVGYGSGSVFDHADLRDIVDAARESADFDPRAASLALAISARDDGFGARAVFRVDGGFGSFDDLVGEPADIEGLAALTPADALFFFAGAGLHDALVDAFDNVAEQTPDLLYDFVYPIEDQFGISLERDLFPLIGSSYGGAVGGENLGSDDWTPDDLWVLGLIESPDPAELNGYLNTLIQEIEFECLCDLGIVLDERPGYAHIQWPDRTLSDDRLSDSDGFRRTLALLPANPSTIYFLNLRSLPEDVIADLSTDFAADPEGYDVNLEALLGFAVAGSGDDTSFSFDMVLPIATAAP